MTSLFTTNIFPKSKDVAFITGANRGIGFELARTLARDHDFHILLGCRSPAAGSLAALKLRDEGYAVENITIDITSDDSIRNAAEEIKKKHERLDLLVNNAGMMVRGDADECFDTKRQALQDTFNTNVSGHALVTDAFIPLLSKSPNPRIVFLSSILGSIINRLTVKCPLDEIDSIAFRCSKAALNMLAAHYARKFKEKGWKITMVCPGFVSTDMHNGNGAITPRQAMGNLVRVCTLGPNGETGTFTNDIGLIHY
ncbi:carbonyl reductase [Dothidotthia symphoricarpi CBS 119687]|uniref:Carbonyl reductase n=1 Tax=Dothidotthia symphoricarpi CBS 119687 TaxID=1392245 RepID=A0A6A5ZX97_9PLEO|nr:carbonyl reductase [Dothidotthia symphoricarpi CBS 119687]KAF2124210.1 carbonyl reductase [Dothidotthia symphoricarpi CBS 119687]